MKKLLILLCCFCSFCSRYAYAQEQTILVIESYHKEYAWDASYREGIQDVLRGHYNLKYFEMDTKRLPASQYQARADKAWETYQNLQPVLVMLGDDNALKLLGPQFAETQTPVIYLGINGNPRLYFEKTPCNITGVLERPLFGHSIRIIRKLLPIKNVLILFDSGTTSATIVNEAFEGNRDIRVYGVNVQMRLIGQWEEWQQAVKQAGKNYDALIVGLYHTLVDEDGKHIPDTKVVRWTAEHTPIPPFCFWDFGVGKDKTIGGLVLYGKEQGELAAELALEVLEGGKSPKGIFPMTTRKGRLLFSKSQLETYGIRLPASIAEDAHFID